MKTRTLGRYLGTVKKEKACLVGYGTAGEGYDGKQFGIVGVTPKSLERIWNKLSLQPFDKAKIRRVVYFPAEALTTKRRRPAEGKLDEQAPKA